VRPGEWREEFPYNPWWLRAQQIQVERLELCSQALALREEALRQELAEGVSHKRKTGCESAGCTPTSARSFRK